MSLSLSAPVRVAAIVGGFVVLGGGYFLLGPGRPAVPTVHHLLIRHPHTVTQAAATGTKAKLGAAGAHATPASRKAGIPGEETAPGRTHASTLPGTKAKATGIAHASAPAATLTGKQTAKPKPAPKPVQLAPGLPAVLAAALEQQPVVVAAIINPNAPDDQLAEGEAAAGAALAGAGFVTIDVLDQAQIGPITRTLGLIEDPAVLIYQRPGDVVGKLHGFADKETVAQGVQDAAPAFATPPAR